MLKLLSFILLGTLLLAACSPNTDGKAPLEKQRNVLQDAKKVDGAQRQETEKQQQETEKQTQ